MYTVSGSHAIQIRSYLSVTIQVGQAFLRYVHEAILLAHSSRRNLLANTRFAMHIMFDWTELHRAEAFELPLRGQISNLPESQK